MKKKLLLTFILAVAFCLALSVSALAASGTYYVDHNGALVDADNEDIAYEYVLKNDTVTHVYLYDEDIRELIIPDMPEVTGNIKVQQGWNVSVGIYLLSDKSTKENNLTPLFTSLRIYESVSFDGAGSFGDCFQQFSALREIHCYANATCSDLAFKGAPNFCELHLYGKNINPSKLITNMPTTNMTIIFHEEATGTLNTGEGVHTIPKFASLTNWKLVINPNILPSDPNDPRLGTNWGAVTTTNGWELIVAIPDKNVYTAEQVEALASNHGFASRFDTLELVKPLTATVGTYCELGYAEHNEDTVYAYANGYAASGTVTTGCTNGCGLASVSELDPIIVLLGYSSSMTSNKACVGYMLNETALNLYNEKTGVTLDYGVVAIIPTSEAELAPLYVENGEIKGLEYSIYASIADSYASFDFVIAGFSAEYYETELVMCAYVYDGDKIAYLCASEDEQGNMICAQYDKATTVTFKGMLAE